MSTVRKTITLTSQQDNWIKSQISSGNYTNDSEYIRDLIRREQERSSEYNEFLLQKVELSRNSLEAGLGKSNDEIAIEFAKRRSLAMGLET